MIFVEVKINRYIVSRILIYSRKTFYKKIEMERIQQPLTNVQLEILKAFSYNLDVTELNEFKLTLAQYFAKRAIKGANKVWEEKAWNDDKVEELLHTKLRKSK